MDSYQAVKEEIKRAADIAELIGQYVQLKKAGLNLIGLCPFHSEKEPSFTVSTSKQMFHCFGCKKGGDIFDFWMEYHKVSFPQAMRDLAERYRVNLPQKKMTPSQQKKAGLKEVIYRINGIALEYFHEVLLNKEMGKPGREYLKNRSFDREIIDKGMLGYAPAEWDGLTKYLEGKKIDPEMAVQAGLIIAKKRGGYYDRFRGRVIFPIINLRKQVSGFGGRVLDNSLPKYLNTPETPVFHKSEQLYGLDSAYQSIRDNGRVIIVEGYTDALALKENGINEAVATLGTALTRDHIRRLKGYVKEAIVVFDSDMAGKDAAIKSFPLFLNEGFSARIMVLPEGDDPDSYIRKNGREHFLRLLANAIPIFDYYLDQKLLCSDNGVEWKAELLKEILPIISELNEDPLSALYCAKLAEKADIPESIVLSEFRNHVNSKKNKEKEARLKDRIFDSKAVEQNDRWLLNIAIHSPGTISTLMTNDFRVLLSDPVIIEIFDCIEGIFARNEDLSSAYILERLENETTRRRFREAMLEPSIYKGEDLEQAINDFQKRILEIKLVQSTKRASQELDLNRLNQILKEKREAELKIQKDENLQEGNNE